MRSKDRQGGLLVTWVAAVAAVEPGSPDWEAVVPLLQAARLNDRDPSRQRARWARESLVLRLSPTGELAHSLSVS